MICILTSIPKYSYCHKVYIFFMYRDALIYVIIIITTLYIHIYKEIYVCLQWGLVVNMNSKIYCIFMLYYYLPKIRSTSKVHIRIYQYV